MFNVLFGMLIEFGMAFSLCAISFSIMLLFTSLRFLPGVLPVFGRTIANLLGLSCQIYFFLLNPLDTAIQERWKQSIAVGFIRLATTITTSLVLGCGLFWLLHWPLSELSLTIFVLHGVFVAAMWGEIQGEGGLRLGKTIGWHA